jgi:predicted transcriptional regulator of viral defense system
VALNLIEKLLHLTETNKLKAIITGGRFNITMATGEIAQGAGVKPECFKLLEFDAGSRASRGGLERIGEGF